jgi:hypothetical protein
MTLEQRLQRLERQNRWMKRLGAVMLAVLAVGVLVAQKKAVPDEVAAKRFVLRDDQGRERAALGPLEHGCSLGMFDKDRKIGLALGVWGGPFLVFRDERGETLEFGQKKDGSIDMRLHDKLTLQLVGRKADLVIAGPDGQPVWKASDEMR